MKNRCIFDPATLLFTTSRFHCITSGLNKPGGAGFFPSGSVRVASLPPIGHSYFLPKAATHMHKEILTKNGFTVLVDEQDFESASKYTWRAALHSGIMYARAVQPRLLLIHRHILQISESAVFVDHINGNGLDNRRENLRVCTHAENMRNRRMHKNNTFGYKGVRWSIRCKHWYAEIRINGRKMYLGTHETPIAAARAYDAAARELHGEFANTNFPITG